MNIIRPRRAKYVQLDARLEDLVADYSLHIAVLEYLTNISDCFELSHDRDEFDDQTSDEE